MQKRKLVPKKPAGPSKSPLARTGLTKPPSRKVSQAIVEVLPGPETVDAETDMTNPEIVEAQQQIESQSLPPITAQTETAKTPPPRIKSSNSAREVIEAVAVKAKTAVAEVQTMRDDPFLSEIVPAIFRVDNGLLDLDDEIRSRKRTLHLLNSKLPDFNEEVKMQIKIRDVRIENLLHDNTTLRTLVKEKSLACANNKLRITLKDAEAELAEAKAAKLSLEKRLQTEHENFAEQIQQQSDELEATNLLNETLNEEVEGLRALVQAKEQQMKDSRGDMIKLSEIIRDMTQVNTELNGKIESLNAEIHTLSQKYHEAAVRADHVEELEQQLAAAVNEAHTNGKRADRSERLAEGLKTTFRDLTALSHEIIGKLGELSNVMADIGTALLSEDASRAQRIKAVSMSLNELRAQLQGKTPNLESLEGRIIQFEELTSKIAELQCEVKAKDALVLKLTRDEADLKKMNSSMAEDHTKASQVWSEAAEQSKKRLTDFEQKLEHLLTQLSNLRDDLSKLKESSSRTKTELENKKAAIEDLRHKMGDSRVHTTDLERRLKAVFAEYTKAQESFKSKEEALKISESKAQRVILGFSVMQDEVFKRENEYLSRERLILQLESELEDSKSRFVTLQANVKQTIARELESANEMIQGKEREVSILKEMIRSSHMELKGKDNTILKYKVKYQQHTPPPSKGRKPVESASVTMSP